MIGIALAFISGSVAALVFLAVSARFTAEADE